MLRRLLVPLVLTAAAACSGSSTGPGGSSVPGPRLAPVKVSAPPAAPAEAARMLHPADLGASWRYGFDPGITRHKSGITPDGGADLIVGTTLGTAHWNGTVWAVDQTVNETARRFATPRQARAAIKLYVTGPGKPASEARPQRVGKLLVWHRPARNDKTARVYVLAASTEFFISVSGPSSAGATTVLPATTVINTALHRIAKHG